MRLNAKRYTLNPITGFSLLEITVVLFVLAVGFAAVLSLITKSIAVSSEFANEVIATNLAAENIELLMNRRHTNWLRGCPYDFFDQDNDGNCVIDFGVTSTILFCPSVLSTNINFNSDYIFDYNDRIRLFGSGLLRIYTHTVGSFTPPFSRRLELCRESFPPNGPQDYVIKMKGVVGWAERGRTRTVEVTDYLYDWKP